MGKSSGQPPDPNFGGLAPGAGIQRQPMFGLGGVQRQLQPAAPMQDALDLGGVASMPVNAGTTGQQAILSRVLPAQQQQRTSTETMLVNQGLRPGTEAYNAAIDLLGRQENDQRTQAALQGLNLDFQANQQGFGQALQSGQFANQAQQQGFGQNLAGGQFANQANQQDYQQALGMQNAANDAQAQGFGQQFDVANAANAARQNAYNQQVAEDNSRTQGLFGIGATGIQAAPQIGKLFGLGQQSGGFSARDGVAGAGKLASVLGGGHSGDIYDAPGIGPINDPFGNTDFGGAAPAAGGAAGALGLGGGGGLFGLGASTIPVVGGALAGGAALAKALIGRGREAADRLTGAGGIQSVFGDSLAQISKLSQTDPQGAQQAMEQVWPAFLQQAKAAAAKVKKTDKKAIQQMLHSTPALTNAVASLLGRDPMGDISAAGL